MAYNYKEPPRVCEVCGNEYYLRPNGESRVRFRKRRFCSNECHIKRLGPALTGKPKGSVIMEHLNPLPAETVMILEFITKKSDIGDVFARTDFARMTH